MASGAMLISEKLNRDNYYVWSKIARSDLVEKKCWDAIDPGFIGENGQFPESFSETQREKKMTVLWRTF